MSLSVHDNRSVAGGIHLGGPGYDVRPADPVRVVFVDDDDLYRDTVEVELAEQGFKVRAFADGDAMFAAFANGLRADVIVLEWRLARTTGIDLLPLLRERGVDLPVVFLTGSERSSPIHENLAFKRGALDFIDKGRGVPVLGARLRLVGHKKDVVRPAPRHVVRQGRLSLKPWVNRALWDDVDVNLTLGEYRTVSLLVANAGSYVTYRQIYDCMHYAGFVAGSGEDGYRTNVRSTIKRIRAKFKEVCPGFDSIKNYNGFGYNWGESTRDEIAGTAD